jgi:hypothetical protein
LPPLPTSPPSGGEESEKKRSLKAEEFEESDVQKRASGLPRCAARISRDIGNRENPSCQ